MLQRFAHFTITVRDYDEAIAFFADKLGFELIEDTDLGDGKRWVRVRPAGSTGTGILLARAASETQKGSVGNQVGGRVLAFLETDDFWRDYHAMRAKGVVFVRAPSEQSYGTVAVFEDLYGNRFDLIGPPRLDAHGGSAEESALVTAGPPGIHLLAAGESQVADLVLRWTEQRPAYAIRRVRGARSADKAGFMEEAAAALQFPYYFGKNWDAFSACICDLSWSPELAFVVIVDRADVLLTAEHRDFTLLLEIMTEANDFWRGQLVESGGQREPVRFHTVLACPQDTFAPLLERVESTGVSFTRLP